MVRCPNGRRSMFLHMHWLSATGVSVVMESCRSALLMAAGMRGTCNLLLRNEMLGSTVHSVCICPPVCHGARCCAEVTTVSGQPSRFCIRHNCMPRAVQSSRQTLQRTDPAVSSRRDRVQRPRTNACQRLLRHACNAAAARAVAGLLQPCWAAVGARLADDACAYANKLSKSHMRWY
jgi:hypothetical protein